MIPAVVSKNHLNGQIVFFWSYGVYSHGMIVLGSSPISCSGHIQTIYEEDAFAKIKDSFHILIFNFKIVKMICQDVFLEDYRNLFLRAKIMTFC